MTKKHLNKQILTEVVEEIKQTSGTKKDAGFKYGNAELYAQLQTEAFQRNLRHVPPSAGTDLINSGGTAVFSITTGNNEFIRFVRRPILLRYCIEKSQTPSTASTAKDPPGPPTSTGFQQRHHFHYSLSSGHWWVHSSIHKHPLSSWSLCHH